MSSVKFQPSGADTFSSAMINAHNYMNWVLEIFRPFIGKNVAEIGMGHGGYGMMLKTDRYVGIDIDKSLVDMLQKRHPDKKYLYADISNISDIEKLKNEPFDTVICLNVLEHIEDHRASISNMLSLLEPKGKLLIFVPAFQALYSEMDKLAGHYRRYKTNQLISLTDNFPVKIVKSGYFNSLGGVGWWLNKAHKPNSLNDSSVNNQLKFFDKWLVPFARQLDKLTSKFFGQSAYIIMEKIS